MAGWCARCPALPVTRKCCFCVPVRRGVIIFAYINLVLSLLSLPLLVYLLVEQYTREAPVPPGSGTVPPGSDLGVGAELLPLSVGLGALDVALTVMLLVAAHRKLRRVLEAYVWLGAALQVTMLAVDVMYIESRLQLLNVLYALFLGLNLYQLYLVRCVALRLQSRTSSPPTPQPPPAPRYAELFDAEASL